MMLREKDGCGWKKKRSRRREKKAFYLHFPALPRVRHGKGDHLGALVTPCDGIEV